MPAGSRRFLFEGLHYITATATRRTEEQRKGFPRRVHPEPHAHCGRQLRWKCRADIRRKLSSWPNIWLPYHVRCVLRRMQGKSLVKITEIRDNYPCNANESAIRAAIKTRQMPCTDLAGKQQSADSIQLIIRARACFPFDCLYLSASLIYASTAQPCSLPHFRPPVCLTNN